LCQWNEYVKYEEPSISTQESRFDPTPADPLVFHLHGHYQVPRSLVLTENDHVDFLVNISRDPALLPPRIQRALAGASLLFIGYDPTEWNFRILLRGLIATTEASLRRISVVQVVPPAAIDVAESVQLQETRYLDSYFNTVNTRVYWGTTREFAAELRARWEGFSNGV
jgi:hypothetical protein